MSIQALHFAAPTIEIVSESPRLEMLQTRLKQVGLRPIKAPREIDPALASPLLIDTAVISERDQHLILSACQRYGNRPLVVLGKAKTDSRDLIRLASVDQFSSLSARLDLRQRQLAQKRETELRKETSERLSTRPTPQTKTRPTAIYCGPQSPHFNALKKSLADDGITLSAVLTRHALEAACEQPGTSALIFNLSVPDSGTERLFDQIASLANGAGIALIALVNPDRDTPVATRADQLLDIDASADLADHIHLAAKSRAARCPSDPTLRDTATGLYTKAFLEAHLSAQLKAADQTALPLTVMAIELKDHLRSPKPVAAELLKHLRTTDLAARYSARQIIVSMPATAYSGAIQTARRLQTQCEMIANITVLERRQFHTAQSLVTGLLARPDLAASRRA